MSASFLALLALWGGVGRNAERRQQRHCHYIMENGKNKVENGNHSHNVQP